MRVTTQNAFRLEADYKRWEILLSSLKIENTILILKLSEVLEKKDDKEFISKAEYFQNEFISKDEIIKDLEKDIREELQLLEGTTDAELPIKIIKKHEKLKDKITYLEKNFTSLQVEFDKCTGT